MLKDPLSGVVISHVFVVPELSFVNVWLSGRGKSGNPEFDPKFEKVFSVGGRGKSGIPEFEGEFGMILSGGGRGKSGIPGLDGGFWKALFCSKSGLDS